MTVYDSTRDEMLDVLHMAGWTRAYSGEVEAPTGYFFALDLRDEDLPLIERNYALHLGDLDVSELAGYFVCQVDSNGFFYVTKYDSVEDMESSYEELERQYDEWWSQDQELDCV